MRNFLLIIFILSLSGLLPAQTCSKVLTDEYVFNETPDHQLYLEVYDLFFFRNNEYFNPIVDGYTLLGNQLRPSLIYTPNEQVSFSAGLFLKQDFGKDGFPGLAPLITITLHKPGLEMLFGGIRGNLSHRLIEPLYDFERLLTDPLEYGFQVRWDKPFLFLDTWLHWEQMIEPYDPRQEKIWSGISALVRPVNLGSFSFGLPLMLTASHQGGQISVSRLPAWTLWNAATGIQISWKNTDGVWLNEAGMEHYALLYFLAGPGDVFEYGKGHAWYLNGYIKTPAANLTLSYWRGSRFNSVYGAPVFRSIGSSVRHPGYVEPERRLLLFRLSKDFIIYDRLSLSLCLEPFWDRNHGWDISQGIYLNYRDRFFLTRLRKNPAN